MIVLNNLNGNVEIKRIMIDGNVVAANGLFLEGNVSMPKKIYGTVEWGTIIGEITDQTDLIEYLSVINCGTSTEVL